MRQGRGAVSSPRLRVDPGYGWGLRRALDSLTVSLSLPEFDWRRGDQIDYRLFYRTGAWGEFAPLPESRPSDVITSPKADGAGFDIEMRFDSFPEDLSDEEGELCVLVRREGVDGGTPAPDEDGVIHYWRADIPLHASILTDNSGDVRQRPNATAAPTNGFVQGRIQRSGEEQQGE